MIDILLRFLTLVHHQSRQRTRPSFVSNAIPFPSLYNNKYDAFTDAAKGEDAGKRKFDFMRSSIVPKGFSGRDRISPVSWLANGSALTSFLGAIILASPAELDEGENPKRHHYHRRED
jgi:hypothetical protein